MLRVLVGFKGTDTHGMKSFKRDRVIKIVDGCVLDKDLFASELVIRAERAGVRVKEVPLHTVEKRKPSIGLYKRIPNVLKSMLKLIYVIRLRGD
jgi:hypothetical protein